jgi:hypothetical protein
MNKLIVTGFTAVLIVSCNPFIKKQTGMKKKEIKTGMVEITSFKLNHGVSTTDFEESALSMQQGFLEKQNGFITRTLTVSEDSVWTDIVHWKDLGSLEKAMQVAQKSNVAASFMEKIDFNSIKMSLTTPVLIEK